MNREDHEDIDAERGYSTVGGREQRLRDWFALHEAGEKAGDFEKLVNRLRVKKWTSANPERKRQHANRYYHKSPEIGRRQTARARQRRAAKYRAAAPVITCAECHVEFCVISLKGAQKRKYCSRTCMMRERYQRITPGARRVKRRGNQP